MQLLVKLASRKCTLGFCFIFLLHKVLLPCNLLENMLLTPLLKISVCG